MKSKFPLLNSSLFDETTFYQAFLSDLKSCRKEVIIESPFITTERMNIFRVIFESLVERGIKIYVMTRDPQEHEGVMVNQSEFEISYFEQIGVQALLCSGNHHRKLAMIDRKILWEGSLNILSQNHSREIMRRINDSGITLEMFDFLNLQRVL